ncbi:NUDIX domain-containing protein [Nocardioides sp.]|uniref:NUDIX hydrolase n=1 Tax=Nocardioides sp. TaxID=35761 RepID=UPI0031FEA04B|nr:hydrolase [Nocardioides sp.]
MSSRPVWNRVCARVLPVNSAGEVLLLHGWDPAKPDEPYWFSIGGGIDPGESLVDAAAREMFEETGIRIAPEELGEPVAQEDIEFDWSVWRLVQDQTYFALRIDGAAEIHFGGLEALERGAIDKAGWWTPDALDVDGTAANDQLTEIMRKAVRAVLGGDQ